jgi:hypothetical protein
VLKSLIRHALCNPENVSGVETVTAKRFIMAQDEDGDTYYYSESGDGGSVWELPEGAELVE